MAKKVGGGLLNLVPKDLRKVVRYILKFKMGKALLERQPPLDVTESTMKTWIQNHRGDGGNASASAAPPAGAARASSESTPQRPALPVGRERC